MYRKELELIPYNKIWSYGLVLNGNVVMTHRYGFCNDQKEIIIDCVYDFARPFCEGLAAVCLKGKWGFIDVAGKVVVPCQYFSVDDYSDGVALVGVEIQPNYFDDKGNIVLWREVLYGYIDNLGTAIIPPKYIAGTEFRNGFAFVNVDGELLGGIPHRPTGGEWCKIDKNGAQMSRFFYFNSEYIIYSDNGCSSWD